MIMAQQKKMNHSLLLILALCASHLHANDAVEDAKVEEPKPAELVEEDIPSYKSPYVSPGSFHFADHFDDVTSSSVKWVKSEAAKGEEEKYDGVWEFEAPERVLLKEDLGLVLKSKARHAAISARLVKPFVFADRPFIVQYEVQLQEGQECGGSYIKLLSSGKETTDLRKFTDKTPYTIMFGPDKCGNDIKLHFIFRHVNPLNGTITEKHSRKPRERLEEPFKDKQPHLYQLVLNPDNTFVVRVDHRIVNEGSLLTDFEPPVNPSRDIDDPTDSRPHDWDEREKIADPSATKPEDWDEEAPPQIPDPSASKPEGWLDSEEEMVPDPSAVKPEDWENEIDGEWEAPLITNPMCEKAVGCGLWKSPLISNPSYRGKWRAPLIDNPNYQGKWAPRRIPNPDFFEDANPFKMTSIAAIGLELWSMSSNILFDNVIITDDEAVADEWAAQSFDLKKKQLDKEAETFVARIMRITEEKPWLWAVFILVGGLPLCLFLYFRCFASKDNVPADPKKTDEAQQDEEVEEEEFAQEEAEEPARRTSPRTIKKSDLDEPIAPENEAESVEEDDNESEENTPKPSSRPNSEPPTEGTRKRKPRKD